MIRPAVARGVPKAESLGNAGLLTGKFEALDVHRQPLGAISDPGSRASHSFGEKIPQPVTFSDALDEAKNGVGVSPFKRESRIIEEAPLMALHGEGYGNASRDCVQAVFVA